MGKIILVSIVTTIIVVLGISYFMPNKLDINKNYSIVGGVLRNEGNGWYVINDSGHEPINITKVETTNQSVIIHYSKENKVVSFNVTPDETMASEGYTMGASVGLEQTVISIYDKNKKLIDPNNYKNKLGNIWVNGIFDK